MEYLSVIVYSARPQETVKKGIEGYNKKVRESKWNHKSVPLVFVAAVIWVVTQRKECCVTIQEWLT